MRSIFALAVGQADDVLALAQFAAREVIDEGPEAHRIRPAAPPLACARLRILAMRSDSSARLERASTDNRRRRGAKPSVRLLAPSRAVSIKDRHGWT